jgi:hypothetical protein
MITTDKISISAESPSKQSAGGQEDATYEVDIDNGLERVLGKTANGCQAAIKESWFNKPISDSTGVVEVKEAYKLPAAPRTKSKVSL